jgi:hypothetical protein
VRAGLFSPSSAATMDAFVQTLVQGGLPSHELEELLTKYGLREDLQMKTILQNLKWRELQAEMDLQVGHDTPTQARIDEQVAKTLKHMEEPQPSTSRQTEEPMKV